MKTVAHMAVLGVAIRKEHPKCFKLNLIMRELAANAYARMKLSILQ